MRRPRSAWPQCARTVSPELESVANTCDNARFSYRTKIGKSLYDRGLFHACDNRRQSKTIAAIADDSVQEFLCLHLGQVLIHNFLFRLFNFATAFLRLSRDITSA